MIYLQPSGEKVYDDPLGSPRTKPLGAGELRIDFGARGTYSAYSVLRERWQPAHLSADASLSVCIPQSWASLLIGNNSTEETALILLRVDWCAHQLVVEKEYHDLGIAPDINLLTIQEDDIQAHIFSILYRIRDRKILKNFPELADAYFAQRLSVPLESMTATTYNKLLDDQAKLATVDSSVLANLLTTRASLGMLSMVCAANEVHPRVSQEVAKATLRVDSAMMAVTTVQSLQLQELTQAIANTDRKRAAAESTRDKRLARLGAVTLFPMLVLSLMGTNVLPSEIFSIELVSLVGLGTTIALSLGAAALGYMGIKRSEKRVEEGIQ